MAEDRAEHMTEGMAENRAAAVAEGKAQAGAEPKAKAGVEPKSKADTHRRGSAWIAKTVAQTALFLLCCLLAYGLVSSWIVPQDGTAYRSDAYKRLQKNSVDALFIGASTYWDAISPMVMWQKYGVTGYVFASSNCPPQIQYLMLEEALKTQQPKVVFLAPQFLSRRGQSEDLLRITQGMTNRSLSIEKVETALDIARDVDRRFGMYALAPLLAYHDKWKSIQEVTFVHESPEITMGQRCWYFYHIPLTGTTEGIISKGEKEFKKATKYNQTAIKYYKKSIELCRSRGIEVVFATMPLYHNYVNHEALRDFAKQEGVTYLNFNDPEHLRAMDIDHATEWRDKLHLNFWGAVRFSEYFGALIREQYGVPDRRERGDAVAEEQRSYYARYYEQYGALLPGVLTPPDKVLQTG
ncbi:MAG: hypothetical protein LBD12_05500 [Clostridiales Family XIII bacterium]|jgi:hypothetical protein|nr:hypothetical protein [Clostridiales Family XIII bacterium]